MWLALASWGAVFVAFVYNAAQLYPTTYAYANKECEGDVLVYYKWPALFALFMVLILLPISVVKEMMYRLTGSKNQVDVGRV